jgi:8-oxo-dGTP diphosphatase
VTVTTVCGRKLQTAGFLLDPTGTRAVVVRKNRPAYLAGLLNGVGGKVEAGETPAECQAREFAEEAGVAIPAAGWLPVATIDTDHGTRVFFFAAVAPDDATFATARTCTDEPIETWAIDDLIAPTLGAPCVESLRYLLPMARYVVFHKPLTTHITEGPA